MMGMIDKIRAARESKVIVDKNTFTIRRPTDEEAASLSKSQVGMVDLVKKFTIGWSLKEIDLVPGGTDVEIPFDPELFSEWVADQPNIWTPLANGILEAYTRHTKKREESAKN